MALKEKLQIAFLLVVLVYQIVAYFLPPDNRTAVEIAGALLLVLVAGWAEVRFRYDPRAALEETIISRDRRRWVKKPTEEAKRADGKMVFERIRATNPILFAVALIAFLAQAAVALSGKIGSSGLQTVTLPAVSGVSVFALMVMTAVFCKIVLKEKAFAQAHVIKTGLIFQNMLAAILLFVK